MNYAIYMTSDNTMVLGPEGHIILNEATTIAHSGTGKHTKSVEIGNRARDMQDKISSDITVTNLVSKGRIVNTNLARLFLMDVFKSLRLNAKSRVVFLIPNSLTTAELDEYKSAAYSAGLSDVYFVPAVISSALSLGYRISGDYAGLSINISDDGTDIAVISYYGIVSGGTIEYGGDMVSRGVKDFVRTKYQIEVSDKIVRQARTELNTLYTEDTGRLLLNGGDFSQMLNPVYLTGTDYAEIAVPVFDGIAKAARQVLVNSNPDLINDIIRGNIFISGTLAQTAGAVDFFTRELELPVMISQTASVSAIMGASRLINNLELLEKIVKAN